MISGEVITDELAVANAHPSGASPFGRDDYIRKFRTLSDGIIAEAEVARFLECVQNLGALRGDDLGGLNVEAPADYLRGPGTDEKGIF